MPVLLVGDDAVVDGTDPTGQVVDAAAAVAAVVSETRLVESRPPLLLDDIADGVGAAPSGTPSSLGGCLFSDSLAVVVTVATAGGR